MQFDVYRIYDMNDYSKHNMQSDGQSSDSMNAQCHA